MTEHGARWRATVWPRLAAKKGVPIQHRPRGGVLSSTFFARYVEGGSTNGTSSVISQAGSWILSSDDVAEPLQGDKILNTLTGETWSVQGVKPEQNGLWRLTSTINKG